ncbi:MAG: NAD(P)/FAD-dependent oxidoreductase [Synergistaceae bacterium]|nr:NAD(P)/FAD-dependent oxidoreductase [Synergistaceae bacterium]
MFEVDLLIVGAGPAGLCAALEAGQEGLSVLLVDENAKPGGQLFKQIHKFFGSEMHKAGTRGFRIGENLVREIAECPNITLWLNSVVFSAIDQNHFEVVHNCSVQVINTKKVIVATGAIEKGLVFPGWTLPGVMGAGALQTMININRVRPGNKLLMVGSGNVGLIVSYQFLQAGGESVILVEAANRIGGYGVHASKIRRYGTNIITGCSVESVSGNGKVESAILAKVDDKFQTIKGTQWEEKVDIVAIAAGLYPLMELLRQLGCEFTMCPPLGGWVPVHDERMETSLNGIFIAGDVSGAEEASTAMEEGRLAAWSVTYDLAKCTKNKYESVRIDITKRLEALRSGPYGIARKNAKDSIYAIAKNFSKLR